MEIWTVSEVETSEFPETDRYLVAYPPGWRAGKAIPSFRIYESRRVEMSAGGDIWTDIDMINNWANSLEELWRMFFGELT